ncbi:MAG: hypothetical protein KJ578_11860 [Bacteroidetes bacterium]|nr:hypothetical protein [Bacteroidota bacterium]MBU1578256.1 hypothetical protein [Bacteroidota bacterium]MBU2465202.1 hypothetical protein [Bacteroidota bacterium]MBU2558465.1 hypothetical protein [Bacteroidota bacterium]
MTINQLDRRPQLLTILCIISFLGSGLGAVSNLFVFFNHDSIITLFNDDAFESFGYDFSLFAQIKRNYFIIAALLQIVSFNGVRLMWRLQRAGFHLYAIAQLLMLIVSTIYIYKPLDMFPMFDLLLATVFILLYLRFRDQMH